MILIDSKISIVGGRKPLERSEKVKTDPRASGKSSGDHKPLSEKRTCLHPIFQQILKPLIEATGERPLYHPDIIHSNGVVQQGGKFYVPRRLLHLYDGPAYAGRVIIVEEE